MKLARRSDAEARRGSRRGAPVRLRQAMVMLILSCVALVCASFAQAPPATTRLVNAVVEQPRPFGYTVGDVVTQRVLLQLQDKDFEPAALPRAGRVGVWLERRTPKRETDSDGRRWLIVDYQLINAPQSLRTVTLPGWELKPRGDGPALAIGEWHLTVAPITPRWTNGQSGLVDLLPDRPAPSVDIEPIRRRIVLWSSALIATLIAWLGWLLWRNRRARAEQPFARAWRELHALDESAPAAWQALHRAFDRTAGGTLQMGTLPLLFDRAPHLEPLRPQIEQFYAQSAALFFGATPPTAATLSLRTFCRALRRLEKRHER
jgi:mxaA protein